MYKFLNILIFVVMTIIFSSCMSTAHRSRLIAQSSDPFIRISALTMKLKQQGIEVIHVGETVSVIIPSDTLFEGESANLNRGAFHRLNSVAAFLRAYPKTFVEVAGYVDYTGYGYADCANCKYGSEASQRDKVLTSYQAAKVSRYLWSKGIDARMLYAVGYGSEHPISNDSSGNERAKNRRIEIHLFSDRP